jgi:hypothetical protein
MALLVTCECGEHVMADDSQAGQQVPCPACGKAVELPQAYNPLSTAKYMQTAADAPPIEERPPAGAPCPDCVGSGQCRHCHGTGQLNEALLERITNGINRAVAGIFSTISDLLGAGPSEGRRRIQTRSERRMASACPSCEGRGKCFKCEGTGFAVE